MVQYRYISVVALCTVCIDLYEYVQTARPQGSLLSSGSPAWRCPRATGQPPDTGGAAGRTPRPGMVSAGGAARPAASLRTWPHPLAGWEASPSGSVRAMIPAPRGSSAGGSPGRGGGFAVVPRWLSRGAAGRGGRTRQRGAGRAPAGPGSYEANSVMRKSAAATARGKCSRLGLVPLMLFSSFGISGLKFSVGRSERVKRTVERPRTPTP